MRVLSKEIKKIIAYMLIVAMMAVQATCLNVERVFAEESGGITDSESKTADAYIGSVSYNTLKEAFESAVAGSVIVLNQDVTLKDSFEADEYTIDKNITIDTNNHDVFFDYFTLNIAKDVIFKFTDSKITAHKYGYFKDGKFGITDIEPEDKEECIDISGGSLMMSSPLSEGGIINAEDADFIIENVNVIRNLTSPSVSENCNHIKINTEKSAKITLDNAVVAIGEGSLITSTDNTFDGTIKLNECLITGFYGKGSTLFDCYTKSGEIKSGFSGKKLTIDKSLFLCNSNILPMWVSCDELFEITDTNFTANDTNDYVGSGIDALVCVMSDALISGCDYLDNESSFINICDEVYSVSDNKVTTVSDNEINVFVSNCEFTDNDLYGENTKTKYLINCDETLVNDYIGKSSFSKDYKGYNANIEISNIEAKNNDACILNLKSQKNTKIKDAKITNNQLGTGDIKYLEEASSVILDNLAATDVSAVEKISELDNVEIKDNKAVLVIENEVPDYSMVGLGLKAGLINTANVVTVSNNIIDVVKKDDITKSVDTLNSNAVVEIAVAKALNSNSEIYVNGYDKKVVAIPYSSYIISKEDVKKIKSDKEELTTVLDKETGKAVFEKDHMHDFSDSDKRCVCGYTKKELNIHEHTPSLTWSYNGTHHWHQCMDEFCPEKNDPSKQLDYTEHTSVYTKDDLNASIIHNCADNCGVLAQSIALSVSSNYIYDGQVKSASILGIDSWNENKYETPILKYTKNGVGVSNRMVKNVGNYTAVMTVSDNSVSANFVIEKKELSKENITISKDRFFYTGKYISPEITVMDGDKLLLINIDYTVSGNIIEKDYLDEGETYKIYVTFTGNYKGKASIDWTIVKYERPEGLSIVFVDEDGVELENISYEYTGNKITPLVRVYDNDKLLEEGVDYTLSYSNNINAVNSTTVSARYPYVYVKGKGAYSSGIKKNFTITKVNLANTVYPTNAKVKVKNKYSPSIIYNGVKIKSTEYTLSKKDAYKEAGEYELIVEATEKGNFEGSVVVNVTATTEKLKKLKVTLDTKTKLIFNGEEKLPSFTVEDSTSKKTAPIYLTEGVDYVVSYPVSSINAGSYKILFLGIGDYDGVVSKSFKIEPRKLDEKNKDVYVIAGNLGYYDPDGAKLPYVNVYAIHDRTSGKEIDSLIRGIDYKVSYSSNKQVSTKTSKAKCTVSFLGNYKGSKACKLDFNVNAVRVSSLNIVSVNKIGYTRDGIYAQKPEVEFIKEDGTNITAKTSDYTVNYYLDPECSVEMKGNNKLHIEDGKNYATVYIKVTGKKNFIPGSIYSSYRVYRKIEKTSKTIDISKATITLVYPIDPDTGKEIKKFYQNGSRVMPKVKVTTGTGRNTVTVDPSLYTVSYTNNTLKGTGKIIVSGIGDGTGSTAIGTKTKTFTISPMPID